MGNMFRKKFVDSCSAPGEHRKEKEKASISGGAHHAGACYRRCLGLSGEDYPCTRDGSSKFRRYTSIRLLCAVIYASRDDIPPAIHIRDVTPPQWTCSCQGQLQTSGIRTEMYKPLSWDRNPCVPLWVQGE